ncbi:hypothetical protein HYE82_01070 [Streptomyces sp. BR123]|uniref:hypothetical protein n=1 Tax=Streptomyces sp. BR123 TaxID=2749828 RepID=UPI0015C4BA30|nr:hypothetical protein [Streptomyces sp. BR123]NXY93035.1 hypothetical protein [Streptomyces sp. BR123]
MDHSSDPVGNALRGRRFAQLLQPIGLKSVADTEKPLAGEVQCVTPVPGAQLQDLAGVGRPAGHFPARAGTRWDRAVPAQDRSALPRRTGSGGWWFWTTIRMCP